MSRFPPSFVDEIKNRIVLSDVIGRRVKLHRRGRQATGLCPFHQEKSPSFHVYDDAGHYHCFGCGQHGDVIAFVMRQEGLPFAEAIEKLAQEAGIAIPAASPQEEVRYAARQNLYTITEFATVYFQRQLNSPQGRPAMDYLLGRGLTLETIQKYRLGFAPDRRFQLRQALLAEKIPEALALEAGLILRPEAGGEPYDRFRGRIMFPIFDRQGRAIAFGGRIMSDEKGKPKYLNSPETPLFHKGRELYGLSFAAKAAREKKRLIVVEGYMDVIALAQAGIEEAVAPLGTALTEQQLQLLWRYHEEPILCFDGDQAGENAALRGAERALPILKPGKSCFMAWMPKGDDPDSLVKRAGIEEFNKILGRGENLADFLWRHHLSQHPVSTPERLAGFKKMIQGLINRIEDPDVRQAYSQDYGGRLNALMRSGLSKNKSSKNIVNRSVGGEAARRGTANLYKRQYETLLLASTHHPELLLRYGEEIAALDWPAGQLDKMKNAILEQSRANPHLESKDVVTHLNERGFGSLLMTIMQSNLETFAAASASSEHAERGFVHVLELIRQSAARERELGQGARELASDLSPQSWAVFKARSEWSLAGEGRRRDIDRTYVPQKGVKKLRNENGSK